MLYVVQDSQAAFTLKFPHSTTPSADEPTLSLSKSVFHTPAPGMVVFYVYLHDSLIGCDQEVNLIWTVRTV